MRPVVGSRLDLYTAGAGRLESRPLVHSSAFPTSEHERAAAAVVAFFSPVRAVEGVLLTGSCARGRATRDSCLDIAVLVAPGMATRDRSELASEWEAHRDSAAVFRNLLGAGRYAQVDLDVIDGQFEPAPRHWTSGPDEFELAIGNTLVYSVPLWERAGYLGELRSRWLPYYGDDLRRERLAGVIRYCKNNLDHIPLYVERQLFFQSFNRFYDAFREFLQALFIARRTYPIAYDKWVREQVVDILGLAELYPRLPALLEIDRLEGQAMVHKAAQLRELLAAEVEGYG